MVNPFQFARLPLIYFGSGKISGLTGIVKRYGTSYPDCDGREIIY